MNTKVKRHKVSCYTPSSSNFQGITEDDKEGSSKQEEVIELQCHTLETLPPEVLEMILRLLPFQDVAGSVRLVSRRFSMVATAILNGAFLMVGTRLEAAIKYVETLISKAVTEIERLAWNKSLNILEVMKYQYKMLKAVTWRYTHPPKSARFKRICFYAGSLLDELYNIIRLARVQPAIYVTNNYKTHPATMSPRLTAFVHLCKRFMNYFEKVSEWKLNRSALISGCKAVDVLDCLAEGRQVVAFRTVTVRGKAQEPKGRSKRSGSIVTMGLRYVMKRTWFTCLQVPCAPDEHSWREDQRFMYLRLRRLVGSVNQHHFEKTHFERELLLRANWADPQQSRRIRPPSDDSYSGCGVYGGRFFYYGNMNKYAYESKFSNFVEALSDDSSQDGETDDDEEESERPAAHSQGPPVFDLVIRVDLRCSSDLAPLAVISRLKTNYLEDILDSVNDLDVGNEYQNSSVSTQDYPEIYLKLNIACPASSANRLPSNFTWEQRGPVNGREKHR